MGSTGTTGSTGVTGSTGSTGMIGLKYFKLNIYVVLLIVLFTTVVIFHMKMYEYLAYVIKLKFAWIVVELNSDQ